MSVSIAAGVFGASEGFAALLVFSIPSGVFVGILQWLALRPYIKQASQWFLVTIIGWGLAWVALAYLPECLISGWLCSPVNGLLLGITIGIAQWFVLRQQVSNAYWWIVANALAGFLGSGIGYYLGNTLGSIIGDILGSIVFFIIYLSIFGFIFSMITGSSLAWLLSRNTNLEFVQK